MGNMLATVKLPPMGKRRGRNAQTRASTVANASITADTVRRLVFEVFIVKPSFLEFKKPHEIRAVKMDPKKASIFLRRHYPYQVKGFGSLHLSRTFSTPDLYAVFCEVILAHSPLFVNRK